MLDAADGGEEVSWAFAIHQSPSIPSGLIATRGGPIMASADELFVTVIGRGGHASMPHHANDPIPVACEIVQALQTWVTRRVDAFTPAVVTVARIRAGTTTNVIPETAQLDGTIRTVDPRVRKDAHAAVRRIATHVAAAHDMEATVEIAEGYPVTVNDEAAAATVLDTARWLVGDDLATGHADPGDGRRGLLVRHRAGAGRHGVPRHAARRGATGGRGAEPLEPHGARRGRRWPPASRCTRRRRCSG